MTLQPNTRLGNYEVLSELGSGGMGEVYKAKDLKLGRVVAIKVLPQEMAADAQRLRRFEQEARAASALNHPNIVTIYEIGEHDGAPYIAMEYVEGKTLREILADGPLPNDKLVRYATQMAEGLAKAHQAGIVHRDLKPENIVVSSDGYVKILDFGLAKLMPESVPVDSEMRTMDRVATREGVIVGTVFYMSPEQAAGRSVDFRSDQFSFGSILYEMAARKKAFTPGSVAQALPAIIESDPEPIARLNPRLPRHFVQIVERCLAKNPEDRYDSTRDLARELQDVQADVRRAASPSSRTASRLALASVLLAFVGAVLWWDLNGVGEHFAERERSAPIESVAVLPLENLSGDPEQEYFADGMTEALISGLAKIKSIKVISRTSVMRYKGSDLSLPEIARELSVDAVVEGSVLRAGEEVRITAQLVEGATDHYLWSESYHRELRDILALQGQVAQAIATEIEVQVTPEERARLSRADTVDPRAHEAYLKGLYHFAKFSPDAAKQALEYFTSAIELDPGYAPAYVGMSDVYGQIAYWGFAPPTETVAKSRDAAEKAVELDDTLAAAHVVLGKFDMFHDFNWASAESELKRALELNPNDGQAYAAHAFYLSMMGQPSEGLAEARRSQELDPLSPIAEGITAYVLLAVHEYESAIAQTRKALELAPNLQPAHWLLWRAYALLGRHEEAYAAFSHWSSLMGHKEVTEAMDRIYPESGFQAALRQGADVLAAQSTEKYVPPSDIAHLYVHAGDFDEALKWLERGFEQRDLKLHLIGMEPDWDGWRSDERFRDLLRRMGLPQ